MYPNTRIDKISLINFKNHLNTNLKDLNSFVVLNGNNGSGKTNILEAISLFSPGRGIKNSRFAELPNKDKGQKNFEIKINVKYETGEVELFRSFSSVEKNKNYISPSFETISAYGANGAIIHYNAKNVKKKTLALTRAPQLEIKNYKRKKK